MRDVCVLMFVISLIAAAVSADSIYVQSSSPSRCREMAREMEENLQRHILAPWFPRAVDKELGGFRQGFGEDWRATGTGRERSIVYQSRLTWIASQIAMRYPEKAAEYKEYAAHGVRSILDFMLDKKEGGTFWQVDGQSRNPERNGEKHAYGISFAIYSCVSAFEATHNAAALEFAQNMADWLDKAARDSKNGGYYEALARDGTPILTAAGNDLIGTRYGFKSMNSHIHLLEAFTDLYRVGKRAADRKRLEEVFRIVRDKVYVEPGCLNLFFTPEWRPVPDHDSFGHDVETGYLLVEASAVLGKPDDAKTWTVARRLVDHALQFGWDEKNGGFYDRGGAFGPATHKAKIWWTQAEGLNALLIMHEKFGKETPRYWQAFEKQWAFIRDKQTDSKHGGWFSEVTENGERIPGREKSNAWTDPYHQGRALLNVTAALKRLAAHNP